jgi:large subunit ribosomal protein L31
MKKNIHPDYHNDAIVKCACGNSFTTGSTSKEIHIEICSACHPFYTGKQKLVDNAGRVDRFKKMQTKTAAVSVVRKGKKAKKAKSEARKKSKDNK